MKDIREAFPRDYPSEWHEIPYIDYEDLIRSMGVTILESDRFGSYQGDMIFVLQVDGQFGFLVFGYGSCSACDALQACDTYEELDNLRQRLYDDIRRFDTAEEVADWMEKELDDDSPSSGWYFYEEEAVEFIRDLAPRLRRWGQ